MNIYKIRRKSDGLFSCGETPVTFSKKGRSWKTKSGITQHFQVVDRWADGTFENTYSDCEIVEYEVSELPTGKTSATQFFQEANERAITKLRTQKLRNEKRNIK